MPANKPPLGITPRFVHELQVRRNRMHEIMEGIDRYCRAYRAIPGEWLDELQDLNWKEEQFEKENPTWAAQEQATS